MKRHRGKAGKIQYEYKMITGLRKFLESIQEWEEIQSINPGQISRCHYTGKFTINIQYLTPTGLKCKAKCKGAVQEIFVTTSKPEEVKDKLIKLKVE